MMMMTSKEKYDRLVDYFGQAINDLRDCQQFQGDAFKLAVNLFVNKMENDLCQVIFAKDADAGEKR